MEKATKQFRETFNKDFEFEYLNGTYEINRKDLLDKSLLKFLKLEDKLFSYIPTNFA